MTNDLTEQIQLMHRFFNSKATLPLNFRMYFLKKLKKKIINSQDKLCTALYQDLKKPDYEIYTTELYIVLQEIDTALKNLKKWMKPSATPTAFPLVGMSSVTPVPYGVCAVFVPYNYPFQLALSPLIGAIAAGNCVVLKVSEYAIHTANFISELLSAVFPKHLVYTLLGDGLVADQLLMQPLDYIFFTGSTRVGKKVMQQAAKHLIPVTLELGGKNPTIVDYTCDIKLAAKRIAWGKFTNAGQTCVAPDYVLVHDAVAEAFMKELKSATKKMFKDKSKLSRMINEKHYVNVLQCINEDKIYHGGHFNADELYIEPTLLYPVSLQDHCMQEEIFGPVLPVIPFSKLSVAIDTIKRFPKPLAFYIFSRDNLRIQHLLKHITFGGGCINDTVMHLTSSKHPFGGVGYSGMGSYHGKYTFDTFSHYRTLLQSSSIELPLRYPLHEQNLSLIKSYMRFKFKY